MSINPLCLQAFSYGANNRWLNPQDDPEFNQPITIVTEPLRMVARLIYGFACTTIASTAGIFYHGYTALRYTSTGNAADAKKHFVAGCKDALTLAITLLAVRLFYGACNFYKVAAANFDKALPTLKTLDFWAFKAHPAYLDLKVARLSIFFSAFALSLSPCLIVSPFAFAVNPDAFR